MATSNKAATAKKRTKLENVPGMVTRESADADEVATPVRVAKTKAITPDEGDEMYEAISKDDKRNKFLLVTVVAPNLTYDSIIRSVDEQLFLNEAEHFNPTQFRWVHRTNSGGTNAGMKFKRRGRSGTWRGAMQDLVTGGAKATGLPSDPSLSD